MFGAIWVLEQRSGLARPWVIAVRQSKEFCIWVCLSAQIMATASSSSAPGIPDYLTAIYKYLSFFNLDTGSTVHAECMTSLFSVDYFTFSVIGVILVVHAAMWASHRLAEAAEARAAAVHQRGYALYTAIRAVASKSAGIQGAADSKAVSKHVLSDPFHSVVRLRRCACRVPVPLTRDAAVFHWMPSVHTDAEPAAAAPNMRSLSLPLRHSVHPHVRDVSGRDKARPQAVQLQGRLEAWAGAADAVAGHSAM
jgi:hypothetical protein